MQPTRSTQRDPWLARALVLAAAWWLVDLVVLRAGVPDRLDDTWEYGVAARALLAGQGLRTLVIHPPLWPLHDAALTVPVLIHGPLMPVLLAPFLAIFGPGALDRIAWLGALGATAAVPPIVRLGARCGGGAVGFAAALMWTFAPLTIRAVHHDAGLTVGAALAMAALELATRARARPAAAGIAMGLAALARPELLFGLPLLAVVVGRGAIALLLTGALVLLPWWVHHALAVGQPLFNLSTYLLLGYWGPRPGLTVLRDFALTPERFRTVLAGSWSELLPKWKDFLPHALKRALQVPTPATAWLAGLGAILAVRERRTRGAALGFLAFAALPVGVMTLTVYDDRYLTPLLPLWALGAARGLDGLARRLPGVAGRPAVWIGALALLLAPVVVPFARGQAAEARGLERRLERERERARAWAAGGAYAAGDSLTIVARDSLAIGGREGRGPRLAFSDTPDFLAWTTGRPTVWVTLEEYGRLPAREDGTGRPRRASVPDEAYFHPDEPALPR